MKSKSFELKQVTGAKQKDDNRFDFVGFYKSAAETYKLPESENGNLGSSNLKKELGKRDRSLYKGKRKHKNDADDISPIIHAPPLVNNSFGENNLLNDSKVTTPVSVKSQGSGDGKVKSIMKTKPPEDYPMDGSTVEKSFKSKKRNKSVSFMLEETDAVVVKKTKSDDSINNQSESKDKVNKKKYFKKIVTDNKFGKENKVNLNPKVKAKSDPELEVKTTHKAKSLKSKKVEDSDLKIEKNNESQEKRRKLKKSNKDKIINTPEQPEVGTSITETQDTNKTKKLKKKKRNVKQQNPDTGSEGEPVSKYPKKDIAEDLENLSIGDNAHTLTNLLDEMTVTDKDKKKKLKQKFNKEKKKTVPEKQIVQEVEEKEKIKWNKRKWNKDKKADVNDDVATTIIVENLPISIMLTYKKLLNEHFGKYGLIKKIGIAETYPTEESKPVFTTTINFYSDGAASDALKEENTIFEGSRIHIKRPLPPTETTLVVRSYAELNEQSITSLFTGAGKIRNIRHLVKGKKSMSTAFVEFDGPETVKRAIKMAKDAKVGGKKLYVAKFEFRKKKKDLKTETENGADTEDSND